MRVKMRFVVLVVMHESTHYFFVVTRKVSFAIQGINYLVTFSNEQSVPFKI